MQIREHVGSSKPALILHPSGTSISFAELEEAANRLAHAFRAAGLREGDVIAVIMENNAHIHSVMWAARRSGLYYVLVNTLLTAAEAAYIVDDCCAKAVIGSRATRALCQELPKFLSGGLPALRLIADADVGGWERYPGAVAQHPPTPIADEVEGDLLQYSSGTTGRPKGIVRALTHTSPATSPCLLTPLFDAVGIDGESVYLSPAPLYHTAPSYWSLSVQSLGGTVVVMEKFDPRQALAAVERYRITHAHFVPAMFVRMLKLPPEVRNAYDLSSLRRVVHAAAPCPVEIKRQMLDWWGPIIDEFYSSSEGAGTSFISAEEWLSHPGSVGRPLVGTPHILDDEGTELPPGEIGDIYYDGGLPFTYLNDAHKTAENRDRRGRVTVGDVGYLDEEGYLYLTDRRAHMIISGGVNIYPRETEDALIGHPKVLDAAVFGIPDPEMGQAVKAVVQLTDHSDATEEFSAELLTWLRGRLAHYKCPRSISFEERLPRAETGKLYKQELVARYSARSP
ncbi:fatty-acid--CoA ligase FadD4 [Mycobacterium sp. GA-2829]|uniref:fatty-acid--CoA ligase FadD4 n=1 Tax=Mycobacterium sp. GA-2829 TaxID=1772283 RepID=UPI000740086B|nr:fatty-acid--CoA ligase FadD4 [Mycobacterium sp. GA-2829]KUI29269.1 acyl-CoA synthetase [Mycobacterium sp. GA-2829]